MNDANPAAQTEQAPREVFICYAHQDEDLKDELYIHLASLVQAGKIQPWQDRNIEAGSEWDDESKTRLESANIILLLITHHFILSPYSFGKEMKQAMERHKDGTAQVIPVILKPCRWNQTKFSQLQVVPTEANPVTLWESQEAALQDVIHGIERIADTLIQHQNSTQDN